MHFVSRGKSLLFRVITLLTFTALATLVFSMPCVTASDVEADAKRDAEKDAKNFNKLRWFAGGCLGGVCPFIFGSADIVAGGRGVYFLENQIIIPLLKSHEFTEFCCLSFFGSSVLLPIGYAAFYSPTPRADRFLGKSSDYVNAYTTVYKKRVKQQQIAWSTTGCIVGTSIGLLTLYYTFIRDLAERQRRSMWEGPVTDF